MKRLFCLIACFFLAAGLLAQETGPTGDLETPLTGEASQDLEEDLFSENEDPQTESPASDETFDEETENLVETEEDPFDDEEDPFAEEEDPLAGEEDSSSASETQKEISQELQSWRNYLDQKALILVNLMLRSHKTTDRQIRLGLAEKAREVIEQINEEARKRMEDGRLSEDAYQHPSSIFSNIAADRAGNL